MATHMLLKYQYITGFEDPEIVCDTQIFNTDLKKIFGLFISSGVNFIIIFFEAFTLADSKNVKMTCNFTAFLHFWDLRA
jgi:hypothetical protein